MPRAISSLLPPLCFPSPCQDAVSLCVCACECRLSIGFSSVHLCDTTPKLENNEVVATSPPPPRFWIRTRNIDFHSSGNNVSSVKYRLCVWCVLVVHSSFVVPSSFLLLFFELDVLSVCHGTVCQHTPTGRLQTPRACHDVVCVVSV